MAGGQLRIYQSAAADAGHDDPALADLAQEGRRWQSWHALTRRVVITVRGYGMVPPSQACPLPQIQASSPKVASLFTRSGRTAVTRWARPA
jgi:hypothetical protein